MMTPPIAFVIYITLVGVLYSAGRSLSKTSAQETFQHRSLYASGERHLPVGSAGIGPFFVTVLFFGVLHLGVVILASGSPSPIAAIYVIGLILALVALILG